MNIAKLRGLMAEKNETHEDLGKLLDLSRSSITKKISGVTKFSFEEVILIAKHYNVSIEYLT